MKKKYEAVPYQTAHDKTQCCCSDCRLERAQHASVVSNCALEVAQNEYDATPNSVTKEQLARAMLQASNALIVVGEAALVLRQRDAATQPLNTH